MVHRNEACRLDDGGAARGGEANSGCAVALVNSWWAAASG